MKAMVMFLIGCPDSGPAKTHPVQPVNHLVCFAPQSSASVVERKPCQVLSASKILSHPISWSTVNFLPFFASAVSVHRKKSYLGVINRRRV